MSYLRLAEDQEDHPISSRDLRVLEKYDGAESQRYPYSLRGPERAYEGEDCKEEKWQIE